MRSSIPRAAATLGLAFGPVLFAGCDLPRDPGGTLRRVEGGVLLAGVCDHPPWVVREGDEAHGVEPALLRRFAEGLGARVEFRWGTAERHLADLEHHRLDAVACGLERTTPWSRRVALTLPYHVERVPEAEGGGATRIEHVLAVPPGENGWLVALERFLAAQRDVGEPPPPAGEAGQR